jgi:hypothetical protein
MTQPAEAPMLDGSRAATDRAVQARRSIQAAKNPAESTPDRQRQGYTRYDREPNDVE